VVTYQLTSTLIGVGIAISILILVRRDHMRGSYAVWWLCVATIALLLGLFPKVFDKWAIWVGVSYPPVLALVLGLGLILIKMLTMDLERSRQERKIRRLAQRLAMLEVKPRMSNANDTAIDEDTESL
jgi:hypothetical protein